jgi:DNA anti-recombination protein RmuC
VSNCIFSTLFKEEKMINTKHMLASTCAAVVLLLGGTSTVVAATEAPAMTADHATQAQFYTQQAADFRKTAESHRQQAKQDHGKSNSSHASMANHCNRIADSLEAAAKDSDALAAQHRDADSEKK